MTYSGKDFARSHRTVRKNTLQIANDIPEEQYGFRASEDTKSVGELLAHIAASTRLTYRWHGVDKRTSISREDFGAYMQDVNAFQASLKTKADIVAALEQEGASFADWLESVSDASLAEIVTFAPPIEPSEKTRFELLLGPKEHEMHHRGQLMLIQRMIGLVPHLTRARQARS